MDFTGLLITLYKQYIIRGLLEKGLKYNDTIDNYDNKKFVAWKNDKFTWVELVDSMQYIFKTLDDYLQENFKDKEDLSQIHFNVKKCEALTDKDNDKNTLFRALVLFETNTEYPSDVPISNTEDINMPLQVRIREEIIERMNKIEANILELVKSGLWDEHILHEEKCWLDALGWTIRKGEFNE